jgi:hypothetical protein
VLGVDREVFLVMEGVDLLTLAWQATLFACTAAAVCGIIWAGANMDDEESTFEEGRRRLAELDRSRYVIMTCMSASSKFDERPAAEGEERSEER